MSKVNRPATPLLLDDVAGADQRVIFGELERQGLALVVDLHPPVGPGDHGPTRPPVFHLAVGNSGTKCGGHPL